jgi:gamma-glutamyltranspeptidase / glutathione hydrolase
MMVRRSAWLPLLLAMLGCEPRGTVAVEAAESSAAATPPSASATTSASAAPAPVPAKTYLLKGGGAVVGERGMVASEDRHATEAGVEVLKAGGNAVDAAIAVAYALSVTHHSAGSLGGGGFMIVHLASGETHAIDYREVAPKKATVKANDKQLAAGAHGYLSAPVPGVVAGLELARERFGSRPRAELVAPALALAEKGYPYGQRQALVLNWYFERIKKDRALRKIVGNARGDKPIAPGRTLRQPDLAKTLRAIRDRGRAGFYEGEVGAAIARAHAKRGGLVTLRDLAAYRAKLRVPLKIRYRELDVFTMSPPSMGGIAVAAILQNLARLEAPESDSAAWQHLFIESARRAYADRRSVGADPDQADAAVVGPRLEKLLDPAYYAARQPPIDPGKATPSKAIVPLSEQGVSRESPDTTHFSVVDAAGNAVSCTTTLSAAYGAWVAVPGTGVILSNAMGAFSPEGVNTLAPKKRMASSMSPTILVQHGHAVAVIGSPGGDTIPGTVAQVAHNLVDGGMTIDAAIESPRIHHQFRPDQVRSEKRRPLPAKVQAGLAKMGHVLKPSPAVLGDANGIVIHPPSGRAWGHADTRKGGLAAGP